MSEFIDVGAAMDFPDNRTTAVEVNGRAVCVARAAGAFYAFDDSCTHAYAPLSNGEVEDGQVTCPLHGSRFDVATGRPQTLPATRPVRMHEIKSEGGRVLIRLAE